MNLSKLVITANHVELGGSKNLHCKQVTDNLDAIASPVDVVTKKENVGRVGKRSQRPQLLFVGQQVVDVAVDIA